MAFLPRSYYQTIVLLMMAAGLTAMRSYAQTTPATEVNKIRSVRVIPGSDGPAIEIITTRPVTPTITTLKGPSRLVIDLPDSLLVPRKPLDYRSDQIEGIRANQFQNTPPISRVVVDLTAPIGYSWDAAGNRLMIRLKSLEQKIAPAPLPSRPEIALTAPGSAGATVQTVSRTEGQGSSLTAGTDTAILHLPRGGQVRVCPSTTVSVNYSKNGRDMLLAMNTGALEAHYVLDTSADSVMTPDFRILFVGPGEFDFAISSDARGNTCVRSLRGNAGSAIVSELLGDGTYQVKANEEVVFHAGQIAQRSTVAPSNCGCPEEVIPELMAAAGRPQTETNTTQPIPDPDKVHVTVDAPFVFRAKEPQGSPALVQEVPRLSLVSYALPEPLEVTVLPPEPQIIAEKPKNAGFFGKIKGFFSAIFR